MRERERESWREKANSGERERGKYVSVSGGGDSQTKLDKFRQRHTE